MEWLRCEDSSNLFKTPKSVQCCQTGKLKSLIKLVLLKKLRNNLQSISYKPPPLPPLPPHSGAGEGEREGGAVPTIKLSILVHLYEVVYPFLIAYRCKGVAVVQYPPWTLFFRSGTLVMMLGLSIVKLSLCLEIHFTVSDVLCQYQSLRLYPSGIVPKYTSIP